MKKVLILLLLLTITCGCTNNKVNSNDINEIFDSFFKKNTSLVNTYSIGYKYYLPVGVRVIDNKNYNEKLYSNGDYYYLYVDAASYYYRIDANYEENTSMYYSKKLNYNNRTGYVEIEELNDLYKIKVAFNYSKIEAYINKNNLRNALLNICSILNSIKFNDSVIKQKIGDEDVNLGVETFDFYTPRKEGNFIDYINQYEEYKEPDNENSIGNEGNE